MGPDLPVGATFLRRPATRKRGEGHGGSEAPGAGEVGKIVREAVQKERLPERWTEFLLRTAGLRTRWRRENGRRGREDK